MKIGILTYHRSHNYGAMLQAVALRKMLESLGNEVYYIDYWPQHQKNIYSLFLWEDFYHKSTFDKLRYIKTFITTLIPKLLRKRNFNCFYKEQIKPYCKPVTAFFDTIIYGSDQIWRKQGYGYGYNPVYFGINDFHAKRHISYAASIGTIPSEKKDIETVINYVKKLDKISVRETTLRLFLEGYDLKGIEQTVDPTLLIDNKEWLKLSGTKSMINEPYLLYYNLMKGSFDDNEVLGFAKHLNLKVVQLCGIPNSLPSHGNHTVDGPYEFLNLVRYANYVITSSFHGLVFSIIFNRPFLAAFAYNSGRAFSLLSSLSLSSRLLEPKSAIREDCQIEWTVVNSKLDNIKDKSVRFLKNNI